jgi:hypothetical protein
MGALLNLQGLREVIELSNCDVSRDIFIVHCEAITLKLWQMDVVNTGFETIFRMEGLVGLE